VEIPAAGGCASLSPSSDGNKAASKTGIQDKAEYSEDDRLDINNQYCSSYHVCLYDLIIICVGLKKHRAIEFTTETKRLEALADLPSFDLQLSSIRDRGVNLEGTQP
jgi:hypothetical protein